MVMLIGVFTGTCSSLISRTPSGCWMCHIHCLPTTKISVAASGGREFSKYKLEPQIKMNTVISVGTIVQVSSRPRCSPVSGGTSSGERRRYLIMKKKIVEKIRMVKNSVITVNAKYKLSTPWAMDEAALGLSGISMAAEATVCKLD